MTWRQWIGAFVGGMAVATLGFLLVEGRGAAQEGESQPAAQRRGGDPQPGAKLTLEQLKAQWFQVSGGRRLRPKTWPNGARAAVAFGFDTNATGNLVAGPPASLNAQAEQEYGAVEGVPRLLRLLDKHNIAATFFVPAITAQLYPDILPSILEKKRHEIALHGWMHENVLLLNNEAEERRLMIQAIDYFTKVTGKRPVGEIAPGTNASRYTIKLEKELGLLYDGSLMGGDDAYELLQDGQPSGLIELPLKWSLNDTMYFGRTGALPDADRVFQIWQEEFDVTYQERGLLVLALHPPSSGHRAPSVALDRFMAYVKSKPDVWIATREQIASYLKKAVMAP